MKDMLPPGIYDAVVIGARASSRGRLRLDLALAAMALHGTVMMEITPNFSGLESRVIAFDEFYDLSRQGKVKDRHHKRKPQPNRGPVGRKSW